MAAATKKESCLLQQERLILAVFLLIILQFHSASCELEDLSAIRILSTVEKSCVVVLYTPNKAVDEGSMIVDYLQHILAGKMEITFGKSGVILSEDFRWPNGQPLKWVGRTNDRVSLAESDHTIIAFSKKKQDRTCLIAGPKTNAKADRFTGMFTVEDILNWVNVKCHTYISTTGHLTMEGLHRESILHNLFRMAHVSNFTMQNFTSQNRHLPSSLKNHFENVRVGATTCESYVWGGEFSNKMERGFCSDSPSLSVTGTNVNLNALPGMCELNSQTTTRISDDFSLESEDGVSTETMAQCERLSTLPTKEQFFHDYLTTSKPVIIEGAATHWDAFNKWTMEYLRERYRDKQVHIKLAPDGLFEGVDDATNWDDFGTFSIPADVLDKLPFPDLVVVRPATMNLKFSEFLDMISTNKTKPTKPRASAYLEYSSIPAYLPELEQDIEEFPFVHGLLKRKHLNIWLSDGNTLGKLHFDQFDNFLCQIRGTKQLTLFEPHDNTKMYEGHIPEAKLSYDPLTGRFHRKTLQDSTAMVMAPVDILHPDYQRFPAFAETRPLNCTINEGDVLFMPAFWWHEVQSRPNVTERRNLAVNFWYEPFLTKEFPCAHCKLDVNPLYRHLL